MPSSLRAFSSTMARPSLRSLTSEARRSFSAFQRVGHVLVVDLLLQFLHIGHAAVAQPQLRVHGSQQGEQDNGDDAVDHGGRYR